MRPRMATRLFWSGLAPMVALKEKSTLPARKTFMTFMTAITAMMTMMGEGEGDDDEEEEEY